MTEVPRERVLQLLREGAELALAAPAEWLEDLDRTTLATGSLAVIAADPVLRASIRRANRSNLRTWASANIDAPGEPVPPNRGPEPMAIARDLVRRGLDESALDAYRVGQNVAWRHWMQLVFTLTDDPRELQQVLDVSAESISAFLDATIAHVYVRVLAEREELTSGSQAERREVIALLLDGAPISRQRAETRLGYALRGEHTAAVVWSDDPAVETSSLDRVADALGHAAAARPLSVVASTATRWVWTPGDPPLEPLRAALAQSPGVRAAVAGPRPGIEGFRRAHLDALVTQRVLARVDTTDGPGADAGRRLATYASVAMVSLASEDAERARRFVTDTLGELEHADPQLREAVLVFVQQQCNAVRAAAVLFTHRNTLLRRLARADELLPRPLAEHSVDVAVALDIVRWRG